MSCLTKMVLNEVESVPKEGQELVYLMGAIAQGQSAIQEEETMLQPLSMEDIVFLANDRDVEAWVMSSGPDPLDLLLVFEDPATDA